MLKLVIVGDEGCGKSSLMNRFCEDTFSHSYVATIGVDFKVRTVIVDVGEDERCKVKMQMWDTAGQERFSSITTSFYRGADAVFVMYDITSRASFNKVRKWFKGCTDVCGDEISGFVVGNKLDLERYREVDGVEGAELAQRLGLPHFETSAKDNTNVSEAFRQVASAYAQKCHAKQMARQRGARPQQRSRRVAPAEPAPADPGCWAWLRNIFAGFRSRSSSADPDGRLNVVGSALKRAPSSRI